MNLRTYVFTLAILLPSISADSLNCSSIHFYLLFCGLFDVLYVIVRNVCFPVEHEEWH